MRHPRYIVILSGAVLYVDHLAGSPGQSKGRYPAYVTSGGGPTGAALSGPPARLSEDRWRAAADIQPPDTPGRHETWW